ncbi:unnamed protein product, partial [Prorocentrum cordatum]
NDFHNIGQLGAAAVAFLTDLALDGFDTANSRMTVAALRSAAMAVAGWMTWMNPPSMAAFVALVLRACPRQSEAHRPRAGSLAPPIAGSGFNAWGLIVNDARSGRPGIAGAPDELVLVDAPELWPALHAPTLNAPADASLWNFRPAGAGTKFALALRELG